MAAAVTTPAVGLSAAGAVRVAALVLCWGPELKTTGFGVIRLVWLSTLKNSARNCARTRSWMVVDLASERSRSVKPGPVSVSRKMKLDGTFGIHEAILNNPKMQEQLDTMSMRAQGKPKLANAQDAPVVGSSMSGTFSQADAVLRHVEPGGVSP